MAALNTDIPEDLRHRARVAAMERRQTLKDFVIAALEHELERHEAEKRGGGR